MTRPSTTTRVRRPGVRGHIGLESRATITVAGMPVVHPVPTWCDLAGVLPLIDAVILGDAIAGRGASTTDQLLGDTPLARLTQEARTRAGMRGARRLRAAIALVRDGSRSPMETRARLCFIGAGLPEPELNAEIHEDGQWIATADFVWRAQRLIVEYQGDHHRTDRAQWQADIQRLARLNDLGWRVVQMTAVDVTDPVAHTLFIDRLVRLLGPDEITAPVR
ncbi:MAG TPA: DUF559 domain-containing protein [Dermatophilaceae bacterium]|nr:DUF559 domain-containing protein [Dermatophilaceae bacterium]HMT89024.1 DUF559 domain-containing protein [Dermatophilaceae bacterium]